jgi:hypothetical protein
MGVVGGDVVVEVGVGEGVVGVGLGDGEAVTSVSDRLSARKLSPVTAAVCWTR